MFESFLNEIKIALFRIKVEKNVYNYVCWLNNYFLQMLKHIDEFQ